MLDIERCRMPVPAVQRLIYVICRTPTERPRINDALDRFGYRLNRFLESIGTQKRYATGLSRNKAKENHSTFQSTRGLRIFLQDSLRKPILEITYGKDWGWKDSADWDSFCQKSLPGISRILNKIGFNSKEGLSFLCLVARNIRNVIDGRRDAYYNIKTLEGIGAFCRKDLIATAKTLTRIGLTQGEVIAGLISRASEGWHTPHANARFFNLVRRHLGIGPKLIDCAQKLGLVKELAFILNEPDIPTDLRKTISELAIAEEESVWDRDPYRIGKGRRVEVFKYCARVMAEKAFFTSEKTKEIATQTKKPTITFYVLSAAYRLCIENPFNQLREQGLPQEEIAEKIKTFDREVREKRKAGKSSLEARLEVGREWLEKGWFAYFTLPILMKIPTWMPQKNPYRPYLERVQEIADLALAHNYDVVIIDRWSASHDHDNIQNRMQQLFTDRGVGLGTHLEYKNHWRIPSDIKCDHSMAFTLNVFDGIKSDFQGLANVGEGNAYLPVEDQEAYVGVKWNDENRKQYVDYLVLVQDDSGEYRATSSISLFNHFYRAALRELRGY